MQLEQHLRGGMECSEMAQKERKNKLFAVSEHRSLNRVNLKKQRLHAHQIGAYISYS